MTAAAAFLLALSAGQAPATDGCAFCHPGAARDLNRGPHARVLSQRPAAACGGCHGDGAAHAAARGRAPIANPGRLAPSAARASCRACHAESREPKDAVHADPLNCSVCHPVHGATVRPAFAPLAPGAEAAPAGPFWAAGGAPRVRFSGDVAAGYRFVHVSGDEKQFDQDTNLDSGPRLLELNLRAVAEGEGRPFDEVALRVAGLDDPAEDYSFRAKRDGRWEATVDVVRQNYVYNSEGDPHRFDVKRESWRSRLDVTVREPVGVELTWDRLEREGTAALTRHPLLLPENFFSVAPQDLEEVTNVYGLGVRAELAGIHATLRQGLESFRNEDQRLLDQEPQAFEDFEAQGEDHRYFTELTAVSEFAGGKGRWDFLGLYRSGGGDTEYDSIERGLDLLQMPFALTSHGDADLSGNLAEARTGARFELGERWTVLARVRVRDQDDRGHLTITDEFTVPNPAVIRTQVSTRSKLNTLEGEAGTEVRPVELVLVSAGVVLSRERFVLTEDDTSTKVRGVGPVAGLAIGPWKGWTSETSYRWLTIDHPFTEASPEQGQEVVSRLRRRWNERFSSAAHVKWKETKTDEDFVNEVSSIPGKTQERSPDTGFHTWGMGVSSTWTPAERTRAALSYAIDSIDYSVLTNEIIAGVRQTRVDSFDGAFHSFTLEGEVPLAPRLSLAGLAQAAFARGDTPYDYYTLIGRATFDLTKATAVGGEYRFQTYDPQEPGGADGYRANLVLLFLRWRF